MGIWFHSPGRWKCWFYLLFSLFRWTQCCFLQALLRVGKENATLEKLFLKHFSDFSSVWELHWLHSGWLTGVASSTHCDTREDSIIHTTPLHWWWEEDRVTGDPSDVYISNVSPSFPPCHLPILPLLPLSNTDSNTHIYKYKYTHTNSVRAANLAAPIIFTFTKCKQYVDDILRSTINEVASLKGSYV